MAQRVVETSALMRPIAHFSHAARIGDVIYVGATAGTDAQRELAGTSAGRVDAAAQTRRMFDNLALALELLGGAWSDLVQVKTYLVDMRDIETYRSIARERFAEAPPAHAVAGAWHFPLPQAAVELDAIAIVGRPKARLRSERPIPLASPGPSAGLLCGDHHFATVLPFGPAGDIAANDPQAQAEQALGNLDLCLSAAGLTPRDLVRLHVTIADPRFIAALDEALVKRLTPPYPARTVVAAQLEDARALLQIEALAVAGGGEPAGSEAADLGPASPAMVVGDTLYSSALPAPRAAPGPGDAERQASGAWDRLQRLLSDAGFPRESMVRTNNVLTHWHHFPAFNRAYGPRVAWPYPPRTTVLGTLADPLACVQIEAVAHRHADRAAVLQVPRADGGGIGSG